MSDLFAFKGSPSAGYAQPAPLLSADEVLASVPSSLKRASPPGWPTASEPELVRHYTWLSTRSYGIDTGFKDDILDIFAEDAVLDVPNFPPEKQGSALRGSRRPRSALCNVQPTASGAGKR